MKREMKLRDLCHENIIKYHGLCLLEGKITIVLELSTDGALDKVKFITVLVDINVLSNTHKKRMLFAKSGRVYQRLDITASYS